MPEARFTFNLRAGVLLLWVAAITFVFPIPHTIALRNVLLAGIALFVMAAFPPAPTSGPLGKLRQAGIVLLTLSGWLVVQGLVLSQTPLIVLERIRSDLAAPMLAAACGWWLTTRSRIPNVHRAVLVALAAHMIWVIGFQALVRTHGGSWPGGRVPFADRDYQSSLNGFLISLAVALALDSWITVGRDRLTRRGLLALAALGADLLLRTRNGTVSSMIVSFAAMSVAIRLSTRRRAVLPLIVAGSAILIGLGALSVKADARWRTLGESAAVGWTKAEGFFILSREGSLTSIHDGPPVEESAFIRAALARLAIDAIIDSPLGVGYGHDAFGRTVPPRYGFPDMGGSSHSGILDFTLGAGIPGLALLLLTAGLAIRGGWRQYRQHDDPAGLMFAFLVGGYLLRCLVDGHLSGWRLGLFAFICGVLIGSMKRESRPT